MQQDIIRDIRKRCRLLMNGVASTSMRQKGMSYKVNFGLLIPQIKSLASDYQQDAELARLLWKEDTRELKILATLLYPVAEFSEKEANEWAKEIKNQEIREQVTLNLFQNLSFAKELVKEWASAEDKDIRTTGYWLLVRLFLMKSIDGISLDAYPFIWDDIINEDTFLRNASTLALRHIGRQSRSIADSILDRLVIYKDDEDVVKQETYNSMAFEFEYYFE